MTMELILKNWYYVLAYTVAVIVVWYLLQWLGKKTGNALWKLFKKILKPFRFVKSIKFILIAQSVLIAVLVVLLFIFAQN